MKKKKGNGGHTLSIRSKKVKEVETQMEKKPKNSVLSKRKIEVSKPYCLLRYDYSAKFRVC